MTDDIHIDGHNEEAEFEREDLGAKPVILFLVGLTVGCLLVALAPEGNVQLPGCAERIAINPR